MNSLGYVECHGLSGAIVAADRMLKTADVKLSSVQNTKGNGWVTLQVSGELSAVTVAIQAVKESLPDVYVTSTVIGRPALGLDTLGKTDLLKLARKKKQSKQASEKTVVIKPTHAEKSVDKSVDEQPKTSVEKPTTEQAAAKKETDPQKEQDVGSDNEVTCNLCGDPKCPRKLGEPHKKCIHYNELKNK